jgi:hypothetical protein
MGHLQIVGLIRQLKLNWPLPIENMFEYFSRASSPTEVILGLDCDFSGSGGIPFFYMKSLFMAIIPLATLCLLACYWFGIHNCVRKWRKQSILSVDELRSRLVICSLVFIFLMQASLSKQAFQMFTCMPIGKKDTESETNGYIGSFLSQDLSIDCESHVHGVWRYTVGLGSVLLYSLGIPMTTFLLLCEFAACELATRY